VNESRVHWQVPACGQTRVPSHPTLSHCVEEGLVPRVEARWDVEGSASLHLVWLAVLHTVNYPVLIWCRAVDVLR